MCCRPPSSLTTCRVPLLARWLLGLAMLAQLLVPAIGAARTVVAGDKMVICTAQGFRTVALDPAAPGQPAEHHRCDLCCVACHGSALPPATLQLLQATAYGSVRPVPLPAPPLLPTPRHERPPGRAPPLDIV